MPRENKYNITPIPFEGPDRSKGMFPLPIRCLIVGSSGSGKTTLLWNLITKDWIPFKNLYIFTKSIEQKSYQTLQTVYRTIESKEGMKIAHFYSNCEDIISVDECEPNSLIIFDDCILEKQDQIKSYFTRGRHKNISCIYLSQCYSLVDLKVIRNNLNFLCIFKQNRHYTRKIYDDFVGSDMSYPQFLLIADDCWKEHFSFLTIDLTLKISEGKYKRRFDEAYTFN